MSALPLKKPPGYRDQNQRPNRPPARPPSFYYPKAKRRSLCCRCCCCATVFGLLLIILSGASIGIFFAWYRPVVPRFSVQSFELQKLDVTEKPGGDSKLDSEIAIGVQAKNDNSKLKMIYEKSKISVSCRDDEVSLGTMTVNGFTQNSKNETVVKLTAKESLEPIDGKVAAKLEAEWKSKDLKASAVVQSKVGFGGERWRTWTVGIKVKCGPLSLKQIDSSPGPKCNFVPVGWFWIF